MDRCGLVSYPHIQEASMKSSRLIPAVVFAFPLLCGAASKEIVELQRDVAQL